MPEIKITTAVLLPGTPGEDWATVRLVPAFQRPLKDGDFVAFRGPTAHREAEKFANQVISQRYGRSVEWYEVDPWNSRCTMVAQVKGGGRWINDVYFIIG